MKLRAIQKLVLALVGLVGAYTLADSEVLSRDRVKAFYVYPVSNDGDVASGWIEIRTVGEGDPQVLDRIGLAEVGFKGTAAVSLLAGNRLEVGLQSADNQRSIVLAQMSLADGWYAPAELCQLSNRQPNCRYLVERNPAQQSYTLRVYSHE